VTAAAALSIATPASAATRHCTPSKLERQQNGIKSITTNASCSVADYLASSTSLPRNTFNYGGRTWVAFITYSGGFTYNYVTQTGKPALSVKVTFT
jgi:hypothetical protein